MSVLTDLPRPFFVLAPMDDVTDVVFRRVVADCASPDLFFTEFVNVDGLQSAGRRHLLRKLRFAPEETRLIVQIWGVNPDNYRKTAQQIADGTFAREMGLPEGPTFAGVDINMGCPAKSEVKAGACSALINNRPLTKDIIDATKDGLMGRMPVSVKTRVGFNEVDMSWIAFLLDQKLNMLTVHGRTRKQMSKVPANWDLIGKARRMRDNSGVDTLIVGNGDVRDRAHGAELIRLYGLDGVMIGRGMFQDPYAFAQKSPWAQMPKEQRIALYRKHVAAFAATWPHGERNIATLNKFCKVYISGFDGAKELREQLMHAGSTAALLRLLDGAAKS